MFMYAWVQITRNIISTYVEWLLYHVFSPLCVCLCISEPLARLPWFWQIIFRTLWFSKYGDMYITYITTTKFLPAQNEFGYLATTIQVYLHNCAMWNETHTLLWQCGYGTLHLKIILALSTTPHDDGRVSAWVKYLVYPVCTFIFYAIMDQNFTEVWKGFFDTAPLWWLQWQNLFFSPLSNAGSPCSYLSARRHRL